jgi:hypothetical protein
VKQGELQQVIRSSPALIVRTGYPNTTIGQGVPQGRRGKTRKAFIRPQVLRKVLGLCGTEDPTDQPEAGQLDGRAA